MAMKTRNLRLASFLSLPLVGCVGSPSVEEQRLRRELSDARTQQQQAREEVRANTLACQGLANERIQALASARQLRGDTQYLRSSTAKMSDAITRLSYQDWNKVVPEVQIALTDVEASAQDLDARVGRVLIALHADADSADPSGTK
jgi:hypothetical protein